MSFFELQTFSNNPERFDGQIVVLRGYLEPTGGDLVVYKDEDLISQPEDPMIAVVDTSPNRKLSKEGFFDGPTVCTRNYVELKGVGGFHQARGFFGISEIITIRTFTDEAFEGPGKLCYSAE